MLTLPQKRLSMKFSEFIKYSHQHGINLNRFFSDSNITVCQQQKFKTDDFVPSYILLMFNAYVNAITSSNKELLLKKKKDFLARAKKFGLNINEDELVEIPLFSDSILDFYIDDVEINFVKFVK